MGAVPEVTLTFVGSPTQQSLTEAFQGLVFSLHIVQPVEPD